MPNISKIVLNANSYDIKDTFSRNSILTLQEEIKNLKATISTLKAAAFKDIVTTIADPMEDVLPTELAVKNYVDTRIQAIKETSFDTVIPSGNKLPTASQNTMYKIYFIKDPKAQDGSYVEYITLKDETGSYVWEQVGHRKKRV